MADNLPSRRIDREALDRIIRRAAELQASEIDTGEALTEQELIRLGAEVGIDGRYLRQALYEQSSGVAAERGLTARWFGPARVTAGRVVGGEKAPIEEALAHWMTEGEALAVKRRLPDRTVWERQRGFMAEVKRGFGMGGKQYVLARAEEVTVLVTPLEAGYVHVELAAGIGNLRSAAIGATAAATGATGLVGAGLFAFLASAVIFPFSLVAAVPLAAAAAAPVIGSRVQRQRSADMQLALEQVLDRLEHGEIRPRHAGGQPLLRLADEIRKAIGEGLQGQRKLNP